MILEHYFPDWKKILQIPLRIQTSAVQILQIPVPKMVPTELGLFVPLHKTAGMVAY